MQTIEQTIEIEYIYTPMVVQRCYSFIKWARLGVSFIR